VVHDGEEDTYSVDQSRCIGCSHCALVCPVDAVETDHGPLPEWREPGLSAAQVRSFLVGKRSVRIYRAEPLSRDEIDDVLSVGSLTATASNSQDWRAVVLTGGSVGETGTAIMSFYRSVVIAANNPVIRLLLRLTPARRTVRRRHRFRRFIDEYFEGRDRLFFHAPAVLILTYPRRRRHFALTDCVLAGQSMMLYAQSLGLGSCMIGYAEAALNLRKPLRRGLGISPDRRVWLVFTFGRTDRSYNKLPHRRPMPVVYVRAEPSPSGPVSGSSR